MWLEIAYGAIIVGNYIYHRYVEDHPRPKPVGALDLQVPRTDEIAAVPLIYGTCRVRSPVLGWIGNYRAIDLEDIGVGDPEVPGFQYQIDMLFILGIPFDGGTVHMLRFFAADTEIFTSTDLGDGSTPYDNPYSEHRVINTGTSSILKDLYGGYGRGGGIGHEMEIWPGSADQVMSGNGIGDGQFSFVEKKMFFAGISYEHIPSFRRQAAVFFHEWSVGESPNVTAYSFVCRSLSTGSASHMGNSLADDACPAAVLFDLITSPWGKLGISSSNVDIPSFQAASDTLFAEQHGYSRAIESPDDASEVLGDVLRQTDGTIYQDPATGLIVYKLIRFDYDPNNLEDINPDNAEAPAGAWYAAQGWSETYNQVRVRFPDRDAAFNEGTLLAQNMANIVAQGRIRNLDLRFPGCGTRALAQTICSRELAVVSRPVTKATLIVNRSFHTARPGDVKTLTWPKLGISGMVMRIVRVTRGALADGRIRLDMMRDVFDVKIGAFPSPT